MTVVDGLAQAVEAVVRAFRDPARAERPGERTPRLQPWEPSQRLLQQEIDALLVQGADPGVATGRRDRPGRLQTRHGKSNHDRSGIHRVYDTSQDGIMTGLTLQH